MFEKLIDLLIQLWDRLSPLFIVKVFQGAAVLRFGRFNREVGPGIYWKIPVIEDVMFVETCITTIRLPPQTVTTKDGKSVVVSVIAKYQVTDLEPYVTKIWDQHDVLADCTMGAVRKSVTEMDWLALVTEPPEKRITEIARRETEQFGFKILRVTFIDLGNVRSIRLITHTENKIDN